VNDYSVVKADTYEAAVTIAKDCPAVIEGGSVEIRQLAGLGPPKG
jgi:hypothetical protein